MILTIFDVDLHNNVVYLQKLIVEPYNEKNWRLVDEEMNNVF